LPLLLFIVTFLITANSSLTHRIKTIQKTSLFGDWLEAGGYNPNFRHDLSLRFHQQSTMPF